MKTQMKLAKIVTFCLALTLTIGTFSSNAFAAESPQVTQSAKFYTITNPYEDVDWATYGQYKADFHAHSTNSDGGNLTKDMVEDHYAKGFDILSMTDHNYLTANWDKAAIGAISSQRKAEIEAGLGRGGKGMIDIDNCDEQSVTDHINSFFAVFNNQSGATMASTIAAVEALGGITHINHPGRYTGGSSGGTQGIAASNNPATVKKYVNLFQAYDSCIGMEIVNKIDNESRSDRILWDNILKEMMPSGRFVWGFSNDDTHSLNATGYSWNVMLMPSLTQSATRTAMETGAFYAVSRVSRLDGINGTLPNGSSMPGSGNSSTLYLLQQSTPSISNIIVSQAKGTITITGADYDTVEWIADGQVIATGATLDIHDHEDQINSYVRAQLKSTTGIAFTQPFGIQESELLSATPTASVKKLSGNQNELTVKVTELYSNGVENVIAAMYTIKNNAEGTYTVGNYKVYVNTKGNTQIRDCFIVD